MPLRRGRAKRAVWYRWDITNKLGGDLRTVRGLLKILILIFACNAVMNVIISTLVHRWIFVVLRNESKCHWEFSLARLPAFHRYRSPLHRLHTASSKKHRPDRPEHTKNSVHVWPETLLDSQFRNLLQLVFSLVKNMAKSSTLKNRRGHTHSDLNTGIQCEVNSKLQPYLSSIQYKGSHVDFRILQVEKVTGTAHILAPM
jgi:hypothetical protein